MLKPVNLAPRIYLAGGMRSGWQDGVIAAFPDISFLDPRSHGLKTPSSYTEWDLWAITICDGVFAYLENDNPGGQNMFFELGYADALGKPYILVDEKQASDPSHDRYTGMAQSAAEWSGSSLYIGMQQLGELLRRI